MISRLLTFLTLLALLLGCRAHHYTHAHHPQSAAESVVHLEDKLTELHFYGLIAYKQDLKGHDKKARTARKEMEKIEKEILNEIRHSTKNMRAELHTLISKMMSASPLHAETLHHLALQLNVKFPNSKLTRSELMKEITQVKITREFQVFETNVEHLSYKLESNARL